MRVKYEVFDPWANRTRHFAVCEYLPLHGCFFIEPLAALSFPMTHQQRLVTILIDTGIASFPVQVPTEAHRLPYLVALLSCLLGSLSTYCNAIRFGLKGSLLPTIERDEFWICALAGQWGLLSFYMSD